VEIELFQAESSLQASVFIYEAMTQTPDMTLDGWVYQLVWANREEVRATITY